MNGYDCMMWGQRDNLRGRGVGVVMRKGEVVERGGTDSDGRGMAVVVVMRGGRGQMVHVRVIELYCKTGGTCGEDGSEELEDVKGD